MQPTDIARQAYDAFGTGNMPALRELLSPETVWHINDVKPLNGDYNGVEEVFRFLGGLMEASQGTFAIEVQEVMGNDSHAAALIHETAQRDGKSLSSPAVHVMRMSNDKVVELWASTTDPANEAFWL